MTIVFRYPSRPADPTLPQSWGFADHRISENEIPPTHSSRCIWPPPLFTYLRPRQQGMPRRSSHNSSEFGRRNRNRVFGHEDNARAIKASKKIERSTSQIPSIPRHIDSRSCCVAPDHPQPCTSFNPSNPLCRSLTECSHPARQSTKVPPRTYLVGLS